MILPRPISADIHFPRSATLCYNESCSDPLFPTHIHVRSQSHTFCHRHALIEPVCPILCINQMRCANTPSTFTSAHSQTSFSLVSVTGIIAIPNMMTRAILEGSDVQAARLKIIITFMIAASNALSCIIATHLVLRSYVDSEYRIRSHCI